MTLYEILALLLSAASLYTLCEIRTRSGFPWQPRRKPRLPTPPETL